jgi:hypothetical protein
MRKLIFFIAVLLSVPAKAQVAYGTSATAPGSVYAVSMCTTGTCPEYKDLVLQMRTGKLVLIRRLATCEDTKKLLDSSQDVVSSECVK